MYEIEFYDSEDGSTPVQDLLGKKAILTNGFVKKTQKTPSAVIKLAKKYKADYERRFGR